MFQQMVIYRNELMWQRIDQRCLCSKDRVEQIGVLKPIRFSNQSHQIRIRSKRRVYNLETPLQLFYRIGKRLGITLKKELNKRIVVFNPTDNLFPALKLVDQVCARVGGR